MFGVIGALAALTEARADGQGQEVDVAIYEAVAALMESSMADLELGGVLRARTGSVLPGVAPSNVYPTADGSEVVIAANADSVFAPLVRGDGPARAGDRRALRRPTGPRGEHGRARRADRWLDGRRCRRRACSSVLERARCARRADLHGPEMLSDPQYLAARWCSVVCRTQGWDVPMTGVVPRFARTPGRRAPHRSAARSAHRRRCCGTWPGCTDDDMAELAKAGLI